MISHDRWLLDRVATHILAFEDDGTQVQTWLLISHALNYWRYVAHRAGAPAALKLLLQSRCNIVQLQSCSLSCPWGCRCGMREGTATMTQTTGSGQVLQTQAE